MLLIVDIDGRQQMSVSVLSRDSQMSVVNVDIDRNTHNATYRNMLAWYRCT